MPIRKPPDSAMGTSAVHRTSRSGAGDPLHVAPRPAERSGSGIQHRPAGGRITPGPAPCASAGLPAASCVRRFPDRHFASSYIELATLSPSPPAVSASLACAAASRATGTRGGEQDT